MEKKDFNVILETANASMRMNKSIKNKLLLKLLEYISIFSTGLKTLSIPEYTFILENSITTDLEVKRIKILANGDHEISCNISIENINASGVIELIKKFPDTLDRLVKEKNKETQQYQTYLNLL